MPKSNSRPLLPTLLVGAALIVPVAPALAVTDFQLPPSTTTRPRAQGPVVPGETPPRTATPAPAPTPTPAAAPTPAPVPVVTVPAAAAPSPVPRPSEKPTQAAQTPAAAPVPAAPTPVAAPTAAPGFNPLAQDRPPVASASGAPAAATPAPSPEILPAWWPWAAGGVALLAILGGLTVLFVRRRRELADEAPEIERPVVLERPKVPARVAPAPAREPEPEPDHGPLSMALEARALTISFGAATLTYRITLTNTGQTPLGGVEISGDMVSAHSSLALEDQLASPEAPLAPAHEIARIRPGESVQVNGEFRLPLQAVRPIVQGSARLLVPLARLRIHAAQGGNGALIRTALVGQRATRPGAGLQPFRLDLGPRIYREVTQKIF